MKKTLAFLLAILLLFAAAVVFQPAHGFSPTKYITILDALGNIMSGIPSTTVAANGPLEYVSVLDANKNVISSFTSGYNGVSDGMVADGVYCKNEASISSVSSTTTLTCATTSPFTSKVCNVSHGNGCTGTRDATIVVYGAGAAGADLITTVVGYTSTSVVTLNAAASTTVTTALAVFGTDSSTGFQNLFTNHLLQGIIDNTNQGANGTNGTQTALYIPPGTYIVTANTPVSTVASHLHLKCDAATIVFTGTGPIMQWGDAGTHFTTDHTVEGCTFLGTTAMNTELFYGNYSDKDRYVQNKMYHMSNGTVWLQKGNGDGNFLAYGNTSQGVNHDFDCEHRCDNTNLIGNIFGGYADRAVIMNGNNAETDASFSLISNKCNGSATSIACFDIGSMEGGVITGNYYEALPAGGGATECGIRIGYTAASGFNVQGIKIDGNVWSGHGALAALCSVTNGVSNPTIYDISFKNNFVTNFTDVVDNALGNINYSDFGPNFSSTISGTAYVNTGPGNGNVQVTENSTTADTSFTDAVLITNALRLAGKNSYSSSPVTANNHEVWDYITTGASAFTYNLPASNGDGRLYFVMKEDSGAGAVTITASGSNTIQGANSTLVLTNQYDWVLLASRSSSNTNSWELLGGNYVSNLNGMHFYGQTSGNISMLPQAAAGTYNFNLPITAGLTGQLLQSAAGGSTAMTWGNFGSVWSGISATITASSTDYIANGENATQAVIGTQTNATGSWPMAGTASNLQCFNTTAAQSGGVAYTVYGGNAGTGAEALTCTTNNTVPNNCSDTTHTFAVAAGDLLDVRVVNSNAANATGVASCSFVVR